MSFSDELRKMSEENNPDAIKERQIERHVRRIMVAIKKLL